MWSRRWNRRARNLLVEELPVVTQAAVRVRAASSRE
jgi:hypothetical protein